MKTVYLESVAGVAGDMFTASFVDAGLVSAERLKRLPEELGLDGVRIEIKEVRKATMKATHLNVELTNESWKRHFVAHTHSVVRGPQAHSHEDGHWHAHYKAIDAFLAKSSLDKDVVEFARKVFSLIAEAEANAHGMSMENVSFHEVGTIDSILDVVMAGICVKSLGPARFLASPVKLGRGFVKIAHGEHPIPPPASSRLVIGMPVDGVPEGIVRPNVELSTPTGLAILKALAPEWTKGWPAGRPVAQGMGAGTMDLGAFPNVFRVAVLEDGAAKLPYERDAVTEICYLVDDDTPERIAWACEKLLELGALDSWTVPATGKKGRLAILVHALVPVDEFERIADWILRNTTTFGLRYKAWDRLKLARKFEGDKKIGFTTDGEKLKEKIEFEAWRELQK